MICIRQINHLLLITPRAFCSQNATQSGHVAGIELSWCHTPKHAPVSLPDGFHPFPLPQRPSETFRRGDVSPPGWRNLLSQPSPWLLPSATQGFGVPLTPSLSPFPRGSPAGTAAPARLAQIGGTARALPDAGIGALPALFLGQFSDILVPFCSLL